MLLCSYLFLLQTPNFPHTFKFISYILPFHSDNIPRFLSLNKMDSCFDNQQLKKNGIMVDDGEDNVVVSDSSDDVSSVVSSDSDLFEQVSNSSESDSSSSSPTSSGPLQDMSSLLQQLPFKRGLSKHYNGKSQSFTSLSNVRSLEDLAKPENPYKKKLKSCKSYGGLMFDDHDENQPRRSNSSSRLISKKPSSKGSCSSLSVKKSSSFLGGNSNSTTNRPPLIPHPHRSSSRTNFTTTTQQTPLFALGV
ncbi:hypothetical protein M9H77_05045 [Catharanthus roseus]|uniref:Uncharacterized protein n=1 Tax=Catharanthus roseus TaxID=4058 RepID=A0ACC0CG49_CATRO|nr:hypothetical protein M9H77_05045 [Catharanthus roseus]